MRVIAAMLLASAGPAWAEPYIAVRAGLACSVCHTNATGGGLRTAFGTLYAQRELPASRTTDAPWTGTVAPRLTLGGNARTSGRQFDTDGRDDAFAFDVDRVSLYAAVDPVERVTLYVDEQVAPGGAVNREAWARFNFAHGYAKAGRLFLPFGWRLEDDDALVREATGVNMAQGDDGVELGFTGGAWNGQVAVTNGAGGADEVDDGKLVTARMAWVSARGQVGVSAYRNETDLGDRGMLGAFFGLNTGPVTWLAEYDYIDEQAVVDSEQQVGLLEANWLLRHGHNLKLTAEAWSYRETLDDRFRLSVVYEYFPWAFTQLRVGARFRDSDDPAPALNANEGFVELHIYF
jgi:hypothetical protein